MSHLRKSGRDMIAHSHYCHELSRTAVAHMFGNSGEEHVLIAEFEENRLVRAASKAPEWFLEFWQNRQKGGQQKD